MLILSFGGWREECSTLSASCIEHAVLTRHRLASWRAKQRLRWFLIWRSLNRRITHSALIYSQACVSHDRRVRRRVFLAWLFTKIASDDVDQATSTAVKCLAGACRAGADRLQGGGFNTWRKFLSLTHRLQQCAAAFSRRRCTVVFALWHAQHLKEKRQKLAGTP
jgi:hypothetical protein